MIEYILILPILVSFLIALFAIPIWIRKAKQIGLVGKDKNKSDHPETAESGGIVVFVAFIIGVLCYVAIKTFILKTDTTTVDIFALLTTITLAALIGIVDDLFSVVHGGLSNKLRVFLVLFSAIPLMVINAGFSEINLFGTNLNIGILYPLILIPIGVVGAVTTYNFLAGFNGLETGQGIIIISFLSLVAYLTGSSWLALIGLSMVASLLVFYYHNKFPSSVFPGDSGTYTIGALIAGMAILGNFERIAVFIFVPYIIEIILKLRGGLKKQSFGIPQKDGSLEMPYKKIYGLEHLAIKIIKKIKGKAYERDVGYLISCVQIIICLIALWLFRMSLFA